MFGSKKEILYVGKNFLQGFSVRNGSIDESISLSWSFDRLGSLLKTMRSAIGRTIRLLVGEPFAYVTTIAVPSREKFSSPVEERREVERLAGQYIPEDMGSVQWDYREVSWESTPDPVRFVQVVAFSSSFGNTISPLIAGSGFHIVAAEPESCAVSRLLADRSDPVIIVFRGESVCIVGSIRGIVLSSVTSVFSIDNESIGRVASFLANQFSLVPKTIILAADLSEKDLARFDRNQAEQSGFSIETVALSAPLGLALKEDISGDDREILSVDVTSSAQAPETRSGNRSLVKKDDRNNGDESGRFHLHTLDEQVFSDRDGDKGGTLSLPKNVRHILLILLLIFLAILACAVTIVWRT